jgi:hypothetical protein
MAFSWVHPDIGVRLAIPIRKNKLISGDEDITFLGRQGMADSVFEEKLETKHYNYLVLDTVIYL